MENEIQTKPDVQSTSKPLPEKQPQPVVPPKPMTPLEERVRKEQLQKVIAKIKNL